MRHVDARCGTCNGSGIAPDQSPQPDDEQPCPECVSGPNRLAAEKLREIAQVVNTAIFPDEQAPGMRRAVVALLVAHAEDLEEWRR